MGKGVPDKTAKPVKFLSAPPLPAGSARIESIVKQPVPRRNTAEPRAAFFRTHSESGMSFLPLFLPRRDLSLIDTGCNKMIQKIFGGQQGLTVEYSRFENAPGVKRSETEAATPPLLRCRRNSLAAQSDGGVKPASQNTGA